MADTYEIPIKRRHYAGKAALEAGSLGVQHWAYDETNERFGVRFADGTYRYHSRSDLFVSGAGVLPVIAIESALNARQVYYENDASGMSYAFRKKRTTDGAGVTTLAGVDDDPIGSYEWISYNDAGTPEEIIYSKIHGTIIDASDGSEDGNLMFYTRKAGTLTNTFELKSGLVYSEAIKTAETEHNVTDGWLRIDVSTGQVYSEEPS